LVLQEKSISQRTSLKEIGSFSEVLTLVHERHPSLKEILSQENIGFQLANLESEILVQILLRLKDEGIVALPIHDAILVRTSDTKRAHAIMAAVSQEFSGFSIPVSTSRIEIEISGEDGDFQRDATLSFFSEDILQRTKGILIVDMEKLLKDSVPSPPPVPQEASAPPPVDDFEQEIARSFPLEDIALAIQIYQRNPDHLKDIDLISRIMTGEKFRSRERVLEKERMARLQPGSAASTYKSSKMEKHVGSVAEDQDDKIK
jgi:hypothetical protein